jgi:carbamoyl-phosphate synthase large subunit
MTPMRAIVTGGGSIVGQGVMKALRYSGLPIHVICTDIAGLNPGMIRAEESKIMPPVEQPGSLGVWIEEIRKLKVQCLLIGSEYDLAYFADNKDAIERETGCIVIASPPKTVAIADDKALTTDFLKMHGLPHAKTVSGLSAADAKRWVSEIGYPIVLKPKSGTSSRHVQVIRDDESLVYWYPRTPRPMLQEYLEPAADAFGSEFTCSTFRLADGKLLGPFVSRRTLRDGSSWIVEVKFDEEIGKLITAISECLPSVGSLNVQLMRTKRGPVPFEFNARFSGTTPIRAFFGFNEPEMAIRSYVLGENDIKPTIKTGICVRYIEEIMLEALELKGSHHFSRSGIINHWF